MNRRTLWPLALGGLAVWACGRGTAGSAAAAPLRQTHSGITTMSPDASLVFVAHPDADTVSAVNPTTRAIAWETLLASAPPAMAVDPACCSATAGCYCPGVTPRGLALDPAGTTLYVTGQRSGVVYALDAATGAKKGASAAVCAEPTGVLVDGAGANVFVACSNDDMIAELRASDLSIVSKVPCPRKPWSLAWERDGKTLLATHLLASGLTPTPPVSAGVSVFTTDPLALATTWPIPDVAAETDGGVNDSNPTVPNGEARGIYDAVVRPGTDELWVVHAMLATNTAEPALNFQSTVFPCISILDAEGDRTALLTVTAADGGPSEGGSGVGGAFEDVVSGPQSITFSPDGRFAFVVDANSEDVLVVDADARAEAALVRPLPGHWPVGAVWSPAGQLLVVERNTEDLAVVDVGESGVSTGVDASVGAGLTVTVEAATIPTLSRDPMPAELRLGQKIFNSANSDELPITQNHWLACASCHIEQRTDSVTWRFVEGPRDTPSNAGGVLGTGFLFHTADRRQVSDYWRTIDTEQGGEFGPGAAQAPLLDAVQAYVNEAIPLPVPPTTDPALVAQGQAVFEGPVGCADCHSGALRTDSGSGNPNLDLAGPEVTKPTVGGVLVHDVGTCNTGPFPDVPHPDMLDDPRAACLFDTPSLRGLWDSQPYMHDGSAATLDDAVGVMLAAAAKAGGNADISASDRAALVEYLKSL